MDVRYSARLRAILWAPSAGLYPFVAASDVQHRATGLHFTELAEFARRNGERHVELTVSVRIEAVRMVIIAAAGRFTGQNGMTPHLLNSKPLTGQWKSRVAAGAKGEGMQKSGPNPPFHPERETGWPTVINADGSGRVDFRNWTLHDGFFSEDGRVLWGKYTISEGTSPRQQQGEFCITFVTGTADEPMFIGVAKLNTGVWQAWWGTK